MTTLWCYRRIMPGSEQSSQQTTTAYLPCWWWQIVSDSYMPESGEAADMHRLIFLYMLAILQTCTRSLAVAAQSVSWIYCVRETVALYVLISTVVATCFTCSSRNIIAR